MKEDLKEYYINTLKIVVETKYIMNASFNKDQCKELLELLSAPKQPKPLTTAPSKIYLQWNDTECESTWCSDRVDENDIEYVLNGEEHE